jgi:hypothetical protein
LYEVQGFSTTPEVGKVSGEVEQRMTETLNPPPRRSKEGWEDKLVGKTKPRVLVAMAMLFSLEEEEDRRRKRRQVLSSSIDHSFQSWHASAHFHPQT